MNTIDFNKNNFPLTTTVLGFLQTSAALIEKLAALVGGSYVLSGCVLTGGSVSAGYVVVNGEIMSFAGGSLQTYVRVISTDTVVTVNDATYTRTEKHLEFGTGTGQIEWSTFRVATDLLTMIENNTYQIENTRGDKVNDGISYDYTDGLTSADVVIDLSAVVPDYAKFAIINLEYSGGGQLFRIYAASNAFKFTAGSVKSDCVVVPLNNKTFHIETTGSGDYTAIQINITLIGYL